MTWQGIVYNFDSRADLAKFIAAEVVNTSEAADILGCSRQNLFDLVKRDKLVPIRHLPKDKLFWRGDVEARARE